MNKQTQEQIRREANVNAKAAVLFTDAGYIMEVLSLTAVYVVKPEAQAAFPFCDEGFYVVDAMKGKCTCPDFVKHADLCKHVVAVQDALIEELAEESQLTRFAEMENAELATTGVDYRL